MRFKGPIKEKSPKDEFFFFLFFFFIYIAWTVCKTASVAFLKMKKGNSCFVNDVIITDRTLIITF